MLCGFVLLVVRAALDIILRREAGICGLFVPFQVEMDTVATLLGNKSLAKAQRRKE